MHLKIAWRNIWRNPRRTLVIILAIIIGVWSMVFLGALMRGMENGMIKNGIATLTGHIQIHHTAYRDDPVIENSIAQPQGIRDVLEDTLSPESSWAPRIRINAVANNARHSTGITLVGIDPDREARVSFIGRAANQGRYLTPLDDTGIVVGRALVENFETKLGHKLILMARDSQGEIASRAFKIIGIFQAEMEATEKQFVFVTISTAQHMLKLKSHISEISILLGQNQDVDLVAKNLEAQLPKKVVVETWQEILPLLTAYIELSNGFIFIWYIVVFIAMGFGIVNTTLMAVFERMREFGILKSIGMKPGRIIKQVLTESLILLTLGIIAGNTLGALSIFSFSNGGIDLSAFAAGAEFIGMSRIIYPAIKAARISPVQAMAYT